jgi:hypothetical protein
MGLDNLITYFDYDITALTGRNSNIITYQINDGVVLSAQAIGSGQGGRYTIKGVSGVKINDTSINIEYEAQNLNNLTSTTRFRIFILKSN